MDVHGWARASMGMRKCVRMHMGQRSTSGVHLQEPYPLFLVSH